MIFTYLVSIFLSTADNVLLGVDPVQVFVQWVIVNGTHISQTMNWEYDVWTLLFINYHSVNSRLLTEQQKGCWRWKKTIYW